MKATEQHFPVAVFALRYFAKKNLGILPTFKLCRAQLGVKQLTGLFVCRREKEFATMDEDGDGVVTSEELTKYLDPTHEQRAINEANYLISMADRNRDGFLSEKEMLMNYQLFTGSSMANYAGYLHDEF